MNISDLIIKYGYLLVFIINLLEIVPVVGLIVPGGNTFLMLIGYLTTVTDLNFFLTLIISSIATIIGNFLSYYLGLKGEKSLNGKNKFFITDERLNKGKKFFEKHGSKTLLFARFFSYIRNFHGFFAGISKMEKNEFHKYNIFGGILWSFCFLSIGWIIGVILKDKVSFHDAKIFIDKFVVIFIVVTIISILTTFFYKSVTQGKVRGIKYLRKKLNKK